MVAIVAADKVVFEMEDNYQKQTYRNRAHIAHTNGRLLLNIPIKHSKDGTRQKTKDVMVENDFPWQSQHWKSLQTAYRTSPFFEFYEDDLEPLFTKPVVKLMDHNLKIFSVLSELIGIEVELSKTQRYEVASTHNDLRSLVLSKSEKPQLFKAYSQVFQVNHGFLSNLSILDLLFNEGPNTLQYLEEQQLEL